MHARANPPSAIDGCRGCRPRRQTSFLYLILLFAARPFKRIDDTIVAAVTNVLLVFVFLTAILIKVFDDILDHRRGSLQLAQEVLGYGDSFEISLTLIGIGFVQIILVAGVILWRLRKVTDAEKLHQQHRSLERVKRAIESKQQLRHPAVFITYDVLRQQGRLLSYEEARATGELKIIDTFDQLIEFTRDESTLFVSHQWLGFARPDSADHVQYRALCEACDQLCNLKRLKPAALFVWMECVVVVHPSNAFAAREGDLPSDVTWRVRVRVRVRMRVIAAT